MLPVLVLGVVHLVLHLEEDADELSLAIGDEITECIDTGSFVPEGHITVMDMDSGELFSSKKAPEES